MAQTIILGIESSCDETAAALVADGSHILSTALASQIDLHKKYGGVVPEIAARAHIENIIPILRETIRQARILPDRIDAVAVAACPGLAPALLIGVTAAKTLAWAWQKPLIAVNHIHAHILSPLLAAEGPSSPLTCSPAPPESPSLQTNSLPTNSIALVVSGGHTSLYHCLSPLEVTLIGKTLDDAAGEAFDKVAAILKLPYPGGPSIEELAKDGNSEAIDFPRSFLGKDSFDFSFSGLKTAVLYHCRGKNMKGKDRVPTMTRNEKADIAASFQQAVCDVLVKKTIRAAQKTNAQTILLGGGVAANTSLRNALQHACDKKNLMLLIAPKKFCTDNAAMIAQLAYHKFKAKKFANLNLEPSPSHTPNI